MLLVGWLVGQAWPNHQMLSSGHETAGPCGLPSISSFHAGSHPTHAASYETSSSPVPPVSGADVPSSAQTGAALGRALASVCIGSVRKTKNRFGFSFKYRTLQKFDICSDSFPTQTACNPQFKLKVTKNDITCIQCADKERFKALQQSTQL